MRPQKISQFMPDEHSLSLMSSAHPDDYRRAAEASGSAFDLVFVIFVVIFLTLFF
ncbi:hypothetical protein [Algisphaera agarilytica]|uniref:Uncharacterized protein n=1 Tax=Algisphaera agarilytica TaxID=1385975 RepID=A0A7X0H9Y2_9BACT|nr:hypothetical protein [Algisphaera agarilytica]MBB6430540.1 hypothetical protein [Algisphaera agarilytica]